MPGEVPMPEGDSSNNNSSNSGASSGATGHHSGGVGMQPDEGLVEQLVSMGFSENGCRRAAVATSNTDADAAMNWILEHMDDADFNDPLPTSSTSTSAVTGGTSETSSSASRLEGPEVQSMIEMISSMGYTTDQATAALKATDFDIER